MWPKGDADRWNSSEAACRCNQREYWYEGKVRPNRKCNNECKDGETCHKSWEWFLTNVTNSDKKFRCKAPLEAVVSAASEVSEDSEIEEAAAAAEAERIRQEEEAAAAAAAAEAERIRQEEEAAAAAAAAEAERIR